MYQIIEISKCRFIELSIYQNNDLSSNLMHRSDFYQTSTVDIHKKYQISSIDKIEYPYTHITVDISAINNRFLEIFGVFSDSKY